MKPTSALMDILMSMRQYSLAWSLRRLHCPVTQSALVLEVGSGGNPYFRSNILLDAYEESRERFFAPLVSDRPTVLGFVEHLPFRDKAFDFVIASHVLEHSSDPARFLSELQRVAKAGYIEVPDSFMERINPYRDHRLEITIRDNCLLIRKKENWKTDEELVELYEARVKSILTRETMTKHPFDFHVRYYWEDKIDYELINPEVDASWSAPSGAQSDVLRTSLRQRIGQTVLKFIRAFFSQHRRNAKLSLSELLACPTCRSEDLTIGDEVITCKSCSQTFEIRNGIPVMYTAANEDSKG